MEINLTSRELQVLRYLFTILSNSEIAKDLNLELSSINSVCCSIYNKLGMKPTKSNVKRHTACLIALKEGLIDLDTIEIY